MDNLRVLPGGGGIMANYLDKMIMMKTQHNSGVKYGVLKEFDKVGVLLKLYNTSDVKFYPWQNIYDIELCSWKAN